MKKDENAIKMLMKNAIDTKTLYGWYEDDNGARLMTNGHLIIKLSDTTLDYVGDFQKMNDINDNKCIIDQMNDIVELAKKGEYKTTVNIQDIKIFDRYNTDKKPFCVKYSDNSYIGFNPYYFNKLNILTGSDLLTITDNKSPLYIAGVDIECVLMPVTLVKGYNENNYNKFITELKGCYIQDEADKAARKEKREAKKNAETMTEIKEGETINGFYAYLSGREYFLKTDNKRVTKKVIEHFIKAVGIVKGKNADTIEKMTTLKDNVDYTKGRIYKATLKKNTIGNYTFIDIDGDNFSCGGNIDELKDKLYIFDFDALTPIKFYQDEETTTPDICADNMSATATDKAATKDTSTDLKTIETPVILRYSDYEHIRIKKGYYINISNYDYIIYQKQATSEYTIYNLNYMMPYGYDDFKTVSDAVNHLNDTADKQNEYYNSHNHYTKQEIYNIYASYNFYNKYELVKQYVEKDIQVDHETPKQTETKTATSNNKSVSLFIVKDNPEPVKLPHLKPLNNIPMFQERFKTDFKPLKSHKVYNNRVSNIKPLKKAHNDFVSTVSHNNDKCAISGDMVAVNSS